MTIKKGQGQDRTPYAHSTKESRKAGKCGFGKKKKSKSKKKKGSKGK